MWAESLAFSSASRHTSEVQSALLWQTTPFWAYRNRPAMYWQRSNVHCLVSLCGSGFSEKDYNSLFGYLPGLSTTTPSRHQGFRNLWGMNEWAKEWTQWLTEELPRTSNNPMADALGSVGKTKPQYLRVAKDTKDSIKITSFYEWRDFHHCERHNIYWRLSLHQDSAQHQQNKTGLGSLGRDWTNDFLLKPQAGICMPGLILQTSKNKLSMLGSKAPKEEKQTENTKGFPNLFRQRITVKSLLTSKEEASPIVTSDVKLSSCLSDMNPLSGHVGDQGCLIIGFHLLLSWPKIL